MNRANVSEEVLSGKYEAQILDLKNEIFDNGEKLMAAVECYNRLQQIIHSLTPKLQKNINLRAESKCIWQRIKSFNESHSLLIEQSRMKRKNKNVIADSHKPPAASDYEKFLSENDQFQDTQLIPMEMIKPEMELNSAKTVGFSELLFINPITRLSNSVLLKYEEKKQKLEKELQTLESRLFQIEATNKRKTNILLLQQMDLAVKKTTEWKLKRIKELNKARADTNKIILKKRKTTSHLIKEQLRLGFEFGKLLNRNNELKPNEVHLKRYANSLKDKKPAIFNVSFKDIKDWVGPEIKFILDTMKTTAITENLIEKRSGLLEKLSELSKQQLIGNSFEEKKHLECSVQTLNIEIADFQHEIILHDIDSRIISIFDPIDSVIEAKIVSILIMNKLAKLYEQFEKLKAELEVTEEAKYQILYKLHFCIDELKVLRIKSQDTFKRKVEATRETDFKERNSLAEGKESSLAKEINSMKRMRFERRVRNISLCNCVNGSCITPLCTCNEGFTFCSSNCGCSKTCLNAKPSF